MVIGKLSVLLGLNSAQFQTGMQAAANNVRTFRTEVAGAAASVTSFSSTMMRLSFIGAGIYAATRVVQPIRDFNQAMAQSTAIMGDLSTEMRNKLERTAKDVATHTKFSAAETAAAYYELASAGLSAEQAVAALPQVAAFAQAGMFDLSQATEYAATSQNALGLTVEDPEQNLKNLARVTDVLTEANNMATGSVEDFAAALTTKAAAAMRIVGMDVEEGVAVLAAFAQQGILGEEAGTQFAIVMRDLQTKAIGNKAAFIANNVAVYDATGNMRNMADIISDLETRLAPMSDEMKKATLLEMGFADRSIAAMLSLIGLSDEIREYEARLRGASGVTQEVAKKNLPDFEKILHGTIETLKRLSQVLGEPFMVSFGNQLYVVFWILEPIAKMLEMIRDFTKDVAEANAKFFGESFKNPAAIASVGKAAETAAPKVDKMTNAVSQLDTVARAAPEGLEKLTKKVDDFIASVEADVRFAAFGNLERQLAELAMAGAFELPGGGVDYDKFNRARNAIAAVRQMEAEKKTMEDRRRELEDLADAGRRMTESVMTPMERFNRRQDEANKLLRVGAISWGTYTREMRAATEEMIRQQGLDKGPGLIERGSQEGYASEAAWKSRSDAIVAANAREQPELLRRIESLETVMVKVEENTRLTSTSSRRTAVAVERTEQPEVVDM